MHTRASNIAAAIALPVLLVVLFLSGCAGDGKNGHLETGMARLRQGQFDAAVKLLGKAAKKHPESATAHCNLGIAYWELGLVTRAMASLRRAADLAEDDPRPLEFLGQVFARLERWEEARRTLADAQALDPDSVRILATRALVEFRAGEPAAAQGLLNRALTREPDYPPALYNMAQLQRYLPDGKPAAKTYFERYLGAVSHEDGHTEAARDFIESLAAATVGGGDGSAASTAAPLLQKAREAIAAGDYDTAQTALTSAMEADPASPDALWDYACFLDERARDGAEAKRMYEDFASRFSGDSRADVAARRVGELVEALNVPSLSTVIAQGAHDPQQAASRYADGLARHRVSDWPGAAALYRKAIAFDRNHLYAVLNLGQVYRADGKLRSATEAFEYALTLKPGMPEAAYQLSGVLKDRGLLVDAISRAEAAATLNPDFAKLQHQLGLLYLSANRNDDARTRFERYVALAPDEPLARRTREWLDAQ